MPYDKDIPVGASAIALGDDTIRANQGFIETAFDVEHVFATGGAQTGRHQFGRGTAAARDVIGALGEFVAGSIWFVTDLVAGATILQVYDGTSPYDNTKWQTDYNLVLSSTNAWTKGQSSSYHDHGTIGGGLLTPDFAEENFQKALLQSSITLANPSNKPGANNGGTWMLELTQDLVGSRLITSWGTDYHSSYGITPALSTAPSSVDVLVLTLLSSGSIDVSVINDIKDIP